MMSLATNTTKMHPTVSVTKRITFCSAHFYYNPAWSEAQNEAVFYACSNRYGHGHNYALELTVAQALDPVTGMVVNLKDLKHLLQVHVVDVLDHKHLNHQIPAFNTVIPTLENVLCFIAKQLKTPLANAHLTMTHLQLTENETLYATLAYLDEDPMSQPSNPMPTALHTTLTRCYDFSASHRLHNPQLSDADNQALYSICNNPNGHGHNYGLEVTLSGKPDPVTGMLIDIVRLDAVVKQSVLNLVDHKHLNLDVSFLQGVNPTAENVVLSLWQQLATPLQAILPTSTRLYKVRLLESHNNFADYYGA
jgi:6-pyruvoyltetrahydropterin/6-carboxytetrahydropterin synthase